MQPFSYFFINPNVSDENREVQEDRWLNPLIELSMESSSLIVLHAARQARVEGLV